MSAIVLAEHDFNETYLGALLDAIFHDDAFKAQALAHLAQTVGNSDGFKAVFSGIDDFVMNCIRQDQDQLGFDAFDRRVEWLAYSKQLKATLDAYVWGTKPNPAAVWWPNPGRFPDQYLEGLLPYVHQLGVINKETVVGSAGSCFAWEISANLQARGFNYIVAEPENLPDRSDGLFTIEAKRHPGLEFGIVSLAFRYR